MKQLSSLELQKQINAYIEALSYMRDPRKLYDPIDYVLTLGGKRLRPVLMLMAYNMYREDVNRIFSQAAAIEVYHNFTLLHDDLMDHATVRRGKSTVHVKWNENTAILSGDTMLILSYYYMQQNCPSNLMETVMFEFGRAALEVCEGQQLDMEFETMSEVSEDEYLKMIRLKTSVLLACALKIGALLGGASGQDAQMLYDFGIRIGLAFQLQDDYLDVYGDTALFGKNIGGDILCNKKTFMLITALKNADEKTRLHLQKWLLDQQCQPSDKIKAVTEIYNELSVPDICKAKIQSYYKEGMELLDRLSVAPEKKTILSSYIVGLMQRNL